MSTISLNAFCILVLELLDPDALDPSVVTLIFKSSLALRKAPTVSIL